MISTGFSRATRSLEPKLPKLHNVQNPVRPLQCCRRARKCVGVRDDVMCHH